MWLKYETFKGKKKIKFLQKCIDQTFFFLEPSMQ